MKREGHAMPKYNVFAGVANRVQIYKEQYQKQNDLEEYIKTKDLYEKEELSKSQIINKIQQDNIDVLPNPSLIALTQVFNTFILQIGPLVLAWEYLYGLFTVRDTHDTLSFLLISTYCIIYYENLIWLFPLAPLAIILYIFYNQFYDRKFNKPKITLIKNIKLMHGLMQMSNDGFEVIYYVIDNCLFWKSKE
jgi:hypothetical protein